MAALRSRPWNYHQTLCSCHCKPRIFNYNLKGMGKRKRRLMEAKGFGWEGHDLGAYVISEEDNRFVEALREVQPYVFLNRGRTFVVAIDGEIVDIPIYFDARLQGILRRMLTVHQGYPQQGNPVPFTGLPSGSAGVPDSTGLPTAPSFLSKKVTVALMDFLTDFGVG
ncbi:unnamed protein product [Prunus armeniaca]|uniref:Uncharacterized protein n=1 Tax=Prunus armeniaca TaxID=36596 RepID=A0A6J5V7A9_PRUAR|nr:unnamed protein product [Prunus armeniaca]